MRIPLVDRDMAYHTPTVELLVGASGSDVYRLYLDAAGLAVARSRRKPALPALSVILNKIVFMFA